MKAVVWHGDEDVRVDEVPDPKIEDATDAIVRITSTAICGSDLHLYAGKSPGMKDGDIIGHEPMGVVEEVGADVKDLKPGDRVVLPFNISCGHCFMCNQGLFSQCETTQNRDSGMGASLYGYTHLYGGVPGGQADYILAKQAHFSPIKVPEGPPDERFLYLSDVLPTSWQAVRYADTPKGGTLAVFGLGPIGQMCCRIAKHEGVDRVIAFDHVPERLRIAERYGAETCDINEIDDLPAAVKEHTGGRGADAVIDAVRMESEGSLGARALQFLKVKPDRHAALHDSMSSVRRGGTLSIIGVYGGPDPTFPLGDLFDERLTGTRSSRRRKTVRSRSSSSPRPVPNRSTRCPPRNRDSLFGTAQRDDMRDFELHRWFSAEELEPCTACGKRAAIYIRETGSFLCLECGNLEDTPERPATGPKAA